MVQLLGGVFVSPLIILSVSRNRWVFPTIGGEPPKWMVKIMENPMNKWMIWENPLFLETPRWNELLGRAISYWGSTSCILQLSSARPILCIRCSRGGKGKEPPKLLPQKSSNQTKNSRAVQRLTSWWFQICIIFTQKHGEMIQFDYVIFFRCAETTNKLIWGRVFLPSTLYNPLGLVHVRNLRGAIFEPQIQG